MTDITVYPEDYQALRARLDFVDLDDDLMRMPVLVQEAVELYGTAADQESAASLAYDVVKAETARIMRNEQEKITEAAIERNLPLYEDVQEARLVYNHAKTYTKICEDLARAFRLKSQHMQKYAELTIAGYITPNATYGKRREAINAARRARDPD